MCMCLAQGRMGGDRGEWMRGLCLCFTNPVGAGGVRDVCLCLGCGVWVVFCESRLFVEMAGPGICISFVFM